MAKNKFRVLTQQELEERKKFCEDNNICFISKDPLIEEHLVVEHPELGSVRVNQTRL